MNNLAQYHVTRLPNGVTICSAEMPAMESACLGVWALVGSRHESPRLNGIAHLTEHLLFKGTPTRDAYGISCEIEGMGASVDAYTTEDHSCYSVQGPAETLPHLADVLMDMFCRPSFDPVEMEREREVVLEEIASYQDNPAQHVEDLLGLAAWPDHALGRPITGTEDTVAGIKRGDLFTFHQTRYTGKNVIVTASGKVNHQQVVDLVTPLIGDLPEGEKLICHKVPPSMRINGPRRCEEVRDTEQSQLCIGFHTTGRTAKERHALRILNVLLGENMSSRLFQVLREEHGLCYSIYSDWLPLEDTGLLSIATSMDLNNVPLALELIEGCLREFALETVEPKRLQQAINYTVGQGRVALELARHQMVWCGENIMAFDRVVEPAEAFETLKKVTAEEVREVAEEIFHPKGAAVAYIGTEVPEAALDGFLA